MMDLLAGLTEVVVMVIVVRLAVRFMFEVSFVVCPTNRRKYNRGEGLLQGKSFGGDTLFLTVCKTQDRLGGMSEKLLTASQAAKHLKVSSVTVRVWCKRGLFPHAELKETPFGSGWLIPENEVKNFEPPKMGRPPKAKADKASRTDGKVNVKGSKKGGKK
jgi:Helix-turn-helix domain